MSQEGIAVIWFAVATLVFASVSTSLAQTLFGPQFLPTRVRTLNERHGWPGKRLMSAHGLMRTWNLLLGAALIALALYVPIDGILDQGVHRSFLSNALFGAQLTLASVWLAFLATAWVRWRMRVSSTVEN
jgi:hypothetical protein